MSTDDRYIHFCHYLWLLALDYMAKHTASKSASVGVIWLSPVFLSFRMTNRSIMKERTNSNNGFDLCALHPKKGQETCSTYYTLGKIRVWTSSLFNNKLPKYT